MNNYLKYWTGIESKNPAKYKSENFKIRCYFDNDSDELINYKGENGLVNLEVYREMVKSLKSMGYNAIDIHDQLGRAEFYLWNSYKEYWDYKGDIDHIEKIIDIIHEEGLLVQIPMYLAWAFNPLNESHECWFEHQDTWKQKWLEYMESPLGKCDIFLLRPRSPIYDCKYRCKCDKCTSTPTGNIMTEVFEAIESIILTKKEDAVLICDLYAEGLALFEDGSFKVSKNWLLLYADNGLGLSDFEGIDFNRPYKKGIYLHAGFWLNHTIMDPHISPLYESVKKAYEYGLTDYLLLNGQSFKNFIYLIEATTRMCDENEKFNISEYTNEWLDRVIGLKEAILRNKMVDYLVKLENFYKEMKVRISYLAPSKDWDRGFIANNINILYPLIYQYKKKVNPEYKYVDEVFSNRMKEAKWDYKDALKYMGICEELEKEITKLSKEIKEENVIAAFDDQFVFPIRLQLKQLKLIVVLFRALKDELSFEDIKKSHLDLYDFAVNGSKLVKFNTWHYPKNSRMHHPIPTLDIYN